MSAQKTPTPWWLKALNGCVWFVLWVDVAAGVGYYYPQVNAYLINGIGTHAPAARQWLNAQHLVPHLVTGLVAAAAAAFYAGKLVFKLLRKAR